ncbi:MAG: GNAT family N-acetyltransferase [Alphaproteobacteria bacterium]|nr:GNAT family N-acetyltransferase [Alphaproteobacteria bacterium]
MIVVELDDGCVVHRVEDPAEAEAFRAGFVKAYRDVFARPPYEESFTEDEASTIWDRLVGSPNHITFVVEDASELVAFASAIPLSCDGPVARALAGLVPVRDTMYLAELGVLPEYRDRGLARLLVKARLKAMDPARFTHVVLRAVEGKNEALAMYRELLFTDMGVSMTVTRERIDGTVRSDERHFMSRVLSQVDVDSAG